MADDHDVVRQGVRTILEDSNEGWQVCAEAVNGRDAVAKARELQPDIVVMDLSMPELNGVEATRQILIVSPKTRVIMLTMHDLQQTELEIAAAGGHGYVLKSAVSRDLVDGVRTLLQGRVFFTENVRRKLQEAEPSRTGDTMYPKLPHEILTPREREVVQLLAEGKAAKEVADILKIGLTTVETHRASIMRKLDLHTVADLTRWAIRNKIIEA